MVWENVVTIEKHKNDKSWFFKKIDKPLSRLSMNKNVEKESKAIVNKIMSVLLQGQKFEHTEQKAPRGTQVSIKRKQHNKSVEKRPSISEAGITDCLDLRK